ncbi:MAG TPA: hypothetical protein VHX87_04115 [Galbitalea sp.]|jgi:hypothetical protein|nr:hypothetical protein [Galbitalea sp.]
MVMNIVIASCGFLGSWLLVAGPVWQAAIELREEEIDEEIIRSARSSARVAPKVSPWWWLLPPVAYVKQFRASQANQRAFRDALPPDQLKQTVSFLNKANGWLVVALGALLLAVSETWNLVELTNLPVWVFWVSVVVAPILAIANAVARITLTNRMLGEQA